ncbi:MAG: carboxypeptidase-like regulatory domain-containing protein [Saprospiraceae bacterium]
MTKKIYIFFLFLFFQIGLSAQSLLDKPISFNLQNISISEALFTVSEVADINITFSPKFFTQEKKVSIEAYEEPLRKVLKNFLEETNIDFKLSKGGIVLFRKPIRRMTVSGYLSDAKTDERLVGAHIIELNSLEGNTSNAYGFFSQNFKEGKVKLQVSYLGYQTKIVEVDLRKSKQINIALEPSLTLEEIVVISKTDSVFVNPRGTETTLPLEQLSYLPTAGGEPDIIRFIHLLPGVQSGADGFGGLHVRGGNSDHNLILFDDVPIYNPSHTFGLFSIFNPDIVKSVKFYKGGFPARYDSRISSVLDVRTREGNGQSFSGEFSAGTMATRGLLEIPLKKGKGSILIAGRRTHLNLWLSPLAEKKKEEQDLDGEMNYLFADFNAKANYTLNKKNKIYLSFYTGKDDLSDLSSQGQSDLMDPSQPSFGFSIVSKDSFAVQWGNQIISLRWNHLFNDKMFSNTTATYSKFQYTSEHAAEVQFSIFDDNFQAFRDAEFYSSTITDFSIRTDLDYFINHQHRLRFGANAIQRNFIPGLSEFSSSGSELDSIPEFTQNNFDDNEAIRTGEFNLYAEEEFQKNNWTINGGIRLSAFAQQGKLNIIPQPRLAIYYHYNKYLNFNSTISRTAQFLQLLTRSDSGLPNDLWVPANSKAAPQNAWQITSKVSGQLGKYSNWSVEGFWKKMNNLSRINQSQTQGGSASLKELRIDTKNWESFVEQGNGDAAGIELTLEQQKGRLAGWVSYTFSKTNRNFKKQKTAFSFDSRHGASVACTFHLNKNANFSANWLFQTGRPFSSTEFAEGDVPPSVIDLLKTSDLTDNIDRLPNFHRLDLGLNLHFRKKRWKHHFNLGVYNAYNRKNVFFAYPEINYNELGEETRKIKTVYSLPILPSFSYSVKW